MSALAAWLRRWWHGALRLPGCPRCGSQWHTDCTDPVAGRWRG